MYMLQEIGAIVKKYVTFMEKAPLSLFLKWESNRISTIRLLSRFRI